MPKASHVAPGDLHKDAFQLGWVKVLDTSTSGVGWAVGCIPDDAQTGQGARASRCPTGVVSPGQLTPGLDFKGCNSGTLGWGSWTLDACTSQDQCPRPCWRRPTLEGVLSTTAVAEGGFHRTSSNKTRSKRNSAALSSGVSSIRSRFQEPSVASTTCMWPPDQSGRTVRGGCSTTSTRPFQPQCAWQKARCPRKRAR